MSEVFRIPQVAGRFYPSEKEEIQLLLRHFAEKERHRIDFNLSRRTILGAVLPHAGHIYSGYQTSHFFEVLKNSSQTFDTWIIIHPLHYGASCAYAAEDSDFWITPLGRVKIDKEFIKLSGLPVSKVVHRNEHSAEVILPFIQSYCEYDFSFVSIGIDSQTLATAHEIAASIVKGSDKSGKRICLIASSDFSHYVDPSDGRKMDQRVLDCIMTKNIPGIYREVIDNNLSICGYGPIMAVMDVLHEKNPEMEPVIMARGHSGEVNPSFSVVDYISILFCKDSGNK